MSLGKPELPPLIHRGDKPDEDAAVWLCKQTPARYMVSSPILTSEFEIVFTIDGRETFNI